ncbi:MAG: hypothetical protein JXR52_10480 [Bacteroidales bacterium]|nr:hypothetical protein [Bacteroidales bacterium]MBN2699238.1 hypothetical protein [Bacteroidales bacterium]
MKYLFKYSLFLILVAVAPFSCMKEAPETLPEEFDWDPEIAFPVGETSLGMNEASGFDMVLLDTNDLTGYPYWVELLNLPIEDSADFDFRNFFGASEQVTRILIRVNVTNEFPETASLQAYFRNSNGILLDSMFTDVPMLVERGDVNEQGEPVRPSFSSEDVVFTGDRLDNIQNCATISFRLLIDNPGPDPDFIPFYPTYHIDIQLGAMFQLTL